jgi:hypothetical protein
MILYHSRMGNTSSQPQEDDSIKTVDRYCTLRFFTSFPLVLDNGTPADVDPCDSTGVRC